MSRRPEASIPPGPVNAQIDRALGMLTSTLCVMSACHERSRAAAVVPWVMRCANEPPLVCVAVRKGHGVEPLIRDSRCFALNLVDRADRLAMRTFERDGLIASAAPGFVAHDDPFDALEVCTMVTRSPVLRRAAAALDCEVVRHFDLEEADHELYVGRVLEARIGGT
jgi:flavin reductase (DIM6/NTAB) family NADH-FMN oxidoreductase RutF